MDQAAPQNVGVGGDENAANQQAALMDKIYNVGDGLEGLAGKFKTSDLGDTSAAGQPDHQQKVGDGVQLAQQQ